MRLFFNKIRELGNDQKTRVQSWLLARLNQIRPEPVAPFNSLFNSLFEQLSAAELEWKRVSCDLEKQFLLTGTELEKLSNQSTQFIQESEKLIGFATGQEGDGQLFSRVVQMIEQPIELLTHCFDQTNRLLQCFYDHKQQIEKLLRVESELQNTMAPLRYVQTQFKVVSAPLGAEVQPMFTALTLEIEKLHEQVREVFGTQFKQLAQTRRTLEDVIDTLEKQVAVLQNMVTVQKAHIQNSLATMKEELRLSSEREIRLCDLSHQLGHEVDQVVMGLQFQDIVNQKLQHVTGSLPQIQAKFVELKAAQEEKDACEPMRFLYQSCSLEARQLKAAREDLAQAESSINKSIGTVSNQLSQVDTKCLSLEEFNTLTTSCDGAVQVLLDSIEEVRRLINTTAQDASQAYNMLQPLGSLATGLTSVIRQLSSGIHLIGLNAQVQAARLDQGVGLEVLSARTSEIARDTIQISDRAATQLDQLAAGLAESVRFFDQHRSEALAQQQILNHQGRIEEEKLHAFRDGALSSLNAIGNSLEMIRSQVQQALQTVQYRQCCEPAMMSLESPLLAIAGIAEKWLQSRGEAMNNENHVEDLKRDYTMASEREVYAKVIAATPSPETTAVMVTDPPDSQTGVDLFVDEIPAAPPVERFVVEEPEATKLAGGEAPSKTQSLGDNVELF